MFGIKRHVFTSLCNKPVGSRPVNKWKGKNARIQISIVLNLQHKMQLDACGIQWRHRLLEIRGDIVFKGIG